MASKIRLPAGLWLVTPRPYFYLGLQVLRRNLPWNNRSVLHDAENGHAVFSESGFELGATLGQGSFSKVVVRRELISFYDQTYFLRRDSGLKYMPHLKNTM
jgi:hypothetical protein